MREPAAALLAVDFDGSLAPIVDDPNLAAPVAGAVEALSRLAARLAVVAIVTGRPVEFVRRYVPDRAVVVVGQYGLERDEGGRVLHDPRAALHVGAVADAAADAEARWPGLLIERKGTIAVTVHWRAAPELAPTAREIEDFARIHGLAVVPGRMAAELRPPIAVDKGSALADLLADDGLTAAAFAGDDHGDLAAFGALARWAEAMSGVRSAVRIAVASSESPTALVEAADRTVADPAALTAELIALAGVLEGVG